MEKSYIQTQPTREVRTTYLYRVKRKSPRSKTLTDEDKVNINGKDYNLLFDNLSNMYYVDLPKTDEGYGISNMPEMVVAGKKW